MTAKKLRALCEVMRDFGLTHIKTDKFELQLSAPTPATKSPIVTPPTGYMPLPDEEIKHKVEELKSALALGDAELLDRMFPEAVEDGLHS